jgi:hypothetical protein
MPLLSLISSILDIPTSPTKMGTTQTRADVSNQPGASDNLTSPRLVSNPTKPEANTQTQLLFSPPHPHSMSRSPRYQVKIKDDTLIEESQDGEIIAMNMENMDRAASGPAGQPHPASPVDRTDGSYSLQCLPGSPISIPTSIRDSQIAGAVPNTTTAHTREIHDQSDMEMENKDLEAEGQKKDGKPDIIVSLVESNSEEHGKRKTNRLGANKEKERMGEISGKISDSHVPKE